MNRSTYEMADTWLHQLLHEGTPQESSWPPGEGISWTDFVDVISGYCDYRGWKAIFDGLTCTIYIQHDKEENHAEAQQRRFSFTPDSDDLPF